MPRIAADREPMFGVGAGGMRRPRRATAPGSSVLALLAVLTGSLVGMVGPPLVEPVAAAEVREITLPVHPDWRDELRWTDTWGAPRSGGRHHLGVDMLGAKMIPLVAARPGTVVWGRLDNGRGSILRLRDAEGWEYQYIHLNNDTPGSDDGQAVCTQVFSARLCESVDAEGRVRSGLAVAAGEVIAFMGDGGNAEGTTPHLHFEIYRPVAPGGVEPINPTPSVDAALARLRGAPGPAGPPGTAPPPAAPGEDGFTDHLWFRLFGRYPTQRERAEFDAAAVANGVAAAIGQRLEHGTTAASIDRLYDAFFGRYPDAEGIRYWTQTRGAGAALEGIAEEFAESDEFRLRYQGTDFGVFLDRLYRDVLGRAPDGAGKRYWLDLLHRGQVTRGTIVVYFTGSDEMRALTRDRNEIVALSLLRRGQPPTDADVAGWAQLRGSLPIGTAIDRWYRTGS